MKNLTVMLIAAAALAGCTGKKTADVRNGFRGFTKQCCNLISYGVVFL